jgi:hypothetical protein
MRALNCIFPGRQTQIAVNAKLTHDAEHELAAFTEAVLRQYGAAESERATEDWFAEFQRAEWPAKESRAPWRKVTIQAAARLAARLTQRPVQV